MPWIAGQSRSGYDWPGDLWDRVTVLAADNPDFHQGRPVMPGRLVPPFVPLLRMHRGSLSLEVKS